MANAAKYLLGIHILQVFLSPCSPRRFGKTAILDRSRDSRHDRHLRFREEFGRNKRQLGEINFHGINIPCVIRPGFNARAKRSVLLSISRALLTDVYPQMVRAAITALRVFIRPRQICTRLFAFIFDFFSLIHSRVLSRAPPPLPPSPLSRQRFLRSSRTKRRL